MIKKKCSKCKRKKDLSLFCRAARNKDGLSGECKKCRNDRKNEYYKTKKGVVDRIYGAQKQTSKKRKHRPPEYTKEDLKDWMFSQTIFHELYGEWAQSGYKKNLKPSVDRKNDYIHYCFTNIQLMTWQQNNDKHYTDRKSGKNNKKNRAVIQYSRDNEFMAEYHSIREAERQTGVRHIGEVLKGRYSHAGGYMWRYKSIAKSLGMPASMIGESK